MEKYEWQQARVVVGLLLITIVCIAMAGCGSTPFARAGAYHATQGEANPIGKFEVGLEWPSAECAYVHISQVTEGHPFNNRYDYILLDAVGCSWKFGGIK